MYDLMYEYRYVTISMEQLYVQELYPFISPPLNPFNKALINAKINCNSFAFAATSKQF